MYVYYENVRDTGGRVFVYVSTTLHVSLCTFPSTIVCYVDMNTTTKSAHFWFHIHRKWVSVDILA